MCADIAPYEPARLLQHLFLFLLHMKPRHQSVPVADDPLSDVTTIHINYVTREQA